MRNPFEVVNGAHISDYEKTTTKPVRHNPCGTAKRRRKARAANKTAATSRRKNR